MKLYDKNVNYSVFDGEITLNKDARDHLLKTIFNNCAANCDIQLIIGEKHYLARLMNVPSSLSIQISYGIDVQECFKQMFEYSYDYYVTSRAEAKRIGISTRKIPTQSLERISISETDERLVYKVECFSCQFDKTNRESEECLNYPEGRKEYRKHIRYERNSGVVKVAKEKFKELHNGMLFCEVCGFSFMDKYGEEYIEAHHTIPVSQLGDAGTTRVEDLKMVCSNCHRMLHRSQLLTVEELKEKIR